MTKSKVVDILNLIKTTYSYAYKDFTREQFLELCTIWYECLKSFTDEQVVNAVQVALIQKSTPPVPADIVEYAKRAILLEKPTDTEYWNILLVAVDKIKNTYVQESPGSAYGTPLYQLKDKLKCANIYDELPIEVKKTIDFGTFLAYGGLDEKSLVIERNRFLKAIPEVKQALLEQQLTKGNNLLIPTKSKLLGEKNDEY